MKSVAWLIVVFGLGIAGCASSGGSRRGDLQVSDSWINTRAENEVQPMLGGAEKVSVSTQNGVIFLDGHVGSIERAEQIEQAVTEIRGVREVRNNLVVKR
jgi:osmotically-inducible protein OsmY